MILWPENFVRLAFILAAVLVASSCHLAQSDESENTGAVEDSLPLPQDQIPAIHLKMEWEVFFENKNIIRDNYNFDIKICKDAGLPTRILSQEEMEKIGTGRTEIFFDGRTPFVRQIFWKPDIDDEKKADDIPTYALCQRTLKEESVVRFDDRLKPGHRGIRESQDSLEYPNLASIPGWVLIGNSIVAGQPCKRWRNQHHEVCVWSGGKRWGFDDGPVEMLGCESSDPIRYLNALPLESKLVEQKNGCVLRVKTFSIGKGLLPETASPSGFGGEKPS